ncbi:MULTISPECIES: hypothetical protein [Prevotella]|uniref:hypothetical protein n=1 Tax=Prevotella TaxID=838 RepID=UPI0011B2115C|nr:hypothetical protein [Prevotella sp. oral taxon 313]
MTKIDKKSRITVSSSCFYSLYSAFSSFIVTTFAPPSSLISIVFSPYKLRISIPHHLFPVFLVIHYSSLSIHEHPSPITHHPSISIHNHPSLNTFQSVFINTYHLSPTTY